MLLEVILMLNSNTIMNLKLILGARVYIKTACWFWMIISGERENRNQESDIAELKIILII